MPSENDALNGDTKTLESRALEPLMASHNANENAFEAFATERSALVRSRGSALRVPPGGGAVDGVCWPQPPNTAAASEAIATEGITRQGIIGTSAFVCSVSLPNQSFLATVTLEAQANLAKFCGLTGRD